MTRERAAIGCFCSLNSAAGAEHLARAGEFDWVLIDLQHGEATWADALHLVQAVSLGGAQPWIRVPQNDPAQLMRAADLGAKGVVIPLVETSHQAHSAAMALTYPPEGNRSAGAVRADGGGRPMCLPMIETIEGMRNVAAIAATPGVDGVFVGPVDLARSMGIAPGAIWPDEVVDALDGLVRQSDAAGKMVASVAFSQADVGMLIGRGLDMVAVGSDKTFVIEGARDAARKGAGDAD